MSQVSSALRTGCARFVDASHCYRTTWLGICIVRVSDKMLRTLQVTNPHYANPKPVDNRALREVLTFIEKHSLNGDTDNLLLKNLSRWIGFVIVAAQERNILR